MLATWGVFWLCALNLGSSGKTCQEGLNKNCQCVTLCHYINYHLPKVNGLLPPTVVKNTIGDIKKTYGNTSICSYFDKLEVISTKFHPKLTNPCPFFESTKSSSETKYDINTTQNICARRSKKLYELRKKCLSTHLSRFNYWKVTMNSLFLSICKENTKLLTTMLCMVIGRLCLCLMLESNFTFVVIVIWLPSLT